jgi:hypothetical protein
MSDGTNSKAARGWLGAANAVCGLARPEHHHLANESTQSRRLRVLVRGGCLRCKRPPLGSARAAPHARPSARGRYRRRLEARSPIALAERRAAYHGADRQGWCWRPLAHREHRHHDPGRADDIELTDLHHPTARMDSRVTVSSGVSASQAPCRAVGDDPALRLNFYPGGRSP